MSVSNVRNSSNHAIVQELFSRKTNESKKSLEESLLKPQATATDETCFSSEALSLLDAKLEGITDDFDWTRYLAPLSERAKKRLANDQPIGSGEAMLTKEGREHFEAYQAKKKARQSQPEAKEGNNCCNVTPRDLMGALSMPSAVISATSIEGRLKGYGDQIAKILNHEGINLGKDEKFSITIENGKKIVSGLKDLEKQAKIQEALNKFHNINGEIVHLSGLEFEYGFSTDFVKSSKTYEEAVRNAFQIRAKGLVGDMSGYTGGIAVDWSAMYKDQDGKIHGLPKELEWVSDWDYKQEVTMQDGYEKQTKQNIAKTIHELLDAGYANVPTYSQSDVKYTYSNNGLAFN